MAKNKIKKTLAQGRPDLAGQWHPIKNGSLTPNDVSVHYTAIVWWLYPYDDPKTGNHVLLIDRDYVRLYDDRAGEIADVFDLDDLRNISDLERFRKKLAEILLTEYEPIDAVQDRRKREKQKRRH